MDHAAQEKLRQVLTKPISAKNPQFYVNQRKNFKDIITKQEENIITSCSLPQCFEYFLDTTYQRKLLCLDLDETLIRSMQNNQSGEEDFSISVTL